jgi:tetratricopeptide (TPR) repeat protein
LYYEIQAEVEGRNGALIKSVMAYMLSAKEYAAFDNHTKAWECRYTAAYDLYNAGHIDHAIHVAVDAAKNLAPCTGSVEFLALTHYLIGCAYSAKGDVAAAQSYFKQAEMEAPIDSDTALRSLIAQSSCAIQQGDLAKALQTSREAAELADKSSREHLKAEALIAAAVCLVKMGDIDSVSGVIARALSKVSRVFGRLRNAD